MLRALPVVRVLALDPPATAWAKVEFLGRSGSVYDRIADALVADEEGPVVDGGSGPFAIAVAAAAQKRGRAVRSVIPTGTLDEHQTLLIDARVAVFMVPEDKVWAVAEEEARNLGAQPIVGPQAAHFAGGLGVELASELSQIASEFRPDVVVYPVDAHGLGEGLALALGEQYPLVSVVEQGRGAQGQIEVTAEDCFRARRALAGREGWLVGYAAASTVAALPELRARGFQRPLLLLTDAGDRVFSRDRRLSEVTA